MDTDWLVDFLSVIESGSFTKAANSRNVSQPAFSRRIQTLENWIGVPLFERGIHKVTLTAAGEIFRTQAQEMIELVNVSRTRALAASTRSRNSVQLVCTHTLSFTLVPSLLQRLLRDFTDQPAVTISACTMADCVRSIRDGNSSFIVYHYHGEHDCDFGGKRLRSLDIGSEWLTLVCRADVYDALGPAEPLPFIQYGDESAFKKIVHENPVRLDRLVAEVYRATLAQTVATAVHNGIGAAYCLRSLVLEDLQSGLFVKLPAPDIPLSIRISMPRGRQNDTCERLWRALAQQYSPAGDS